MLDIDRHRIGERVYFQVIALLCVWAVIEFNT